MRALRRCKCAAERALARARVVGLYSLGGFSGAAFILMMLSFGLGPVLCVVVGAGLLKTRSADGDPHFAWLRGVVLIIAALRTRNPRALPSLRRISVESHRAPFV